MGDNIWLFDRNGVRTPMQWSDGPLGGFMPNGPQGPEIQPYAAPIESQEYGYAKVNVEAARRTPGSLLHFHKSLIAVRKANPALGRGRLRWAEIGSKETAAFWRETENASVLCLHNLTSRKQQLELPVSLENGERATIIFGEGQVGRQDSGVRVTLSPYQFLWLGMERD
jgi:maltose alpha-D-glucosyltransferase/alpha-amylase